MTYIAKPRVSQPNLPRNKLGLTARDYEGAVSTLCAGCGHDSVTAAIVQAVFELNVEPHMLAKMSGIGCSSKTPAYFVSQSHGFNSVHGRMPSVTTGANAANRTLTYIGVSGDGDSLSIGAGQFVHAIRRNLNMCYIIENNGVYGLTKGQFSASADIGSKPKKGLPNQQEPIDPVAGHVPGASNLPFSELLDEDLKFRPADELSSLFDDRAKADELIAMCGSGVTACHLLAGLAVAGRSARLYVGSWSEWIRDPARSVAIGD